VAIVKATVLPGSYMYEYKKNTLFIQKIFNPTVYPYTYISIWIYLCASIWWNKYSNYYKQSL